MTRQRAIRKKARGEEWQGKEKRKQKEGVCELERGGRERGCEPDEGGRMCL